MAMAEAERRSSGGPIGPGSGGNVPAFEETKFMKDLIHLRDTQESIQGLSAWTIRNKKAAYKIARCWLKCVKKCKCTYVLLRVFFGRLSRPVHVSGYPEN